jgi:hypothetical protein
VDTYSRPSCAYSRATLALSATEPATDGTPTSHQDEAATSRTAFEPIVVARKPLQGTVAANVTAWGTGALNIDATRVRTTDKLSGGHASAGQQMRDGWKRPWMDDPAAVEANAARSRASVAKSEELGRWPTNVVLTHAYECGTVDQPGPCVEGCPVRELDAQSGTLTSGVLAAHHQRAPKDAGILGAYGSVEGERGYGDTGGASRFFPTTRWDSSCSAGGSTHGATDPDDTGTSGSAAIQEPAAGQSSTASAASGTSPDLPTFRYEAKAPTVERPRAGETAHPTVKPLDLMRWLVRLVTPPSGTVLEPFAGSGTTAEACVIEGAHCIAIEREADYLPLIVARLSKPIELDLFGGVA